MRKKIVAGNWKMNKTLDDGLELVRSLLSGLKPGGEDQEVFIAPPYIHLKMVSDLLDDQPIIKLAAQNCHHQSSGAFTGEISAEMLASVGVQAVIIGHSERRQYFSEDNEMLIEKVNQTLSAKLTPIFCCGESLVTRTAQQHFEFVGRQIEATLFSLPASQFQKIHIAYEPIWAIGTGKTATSKQAQEMHHHIRSLVASKFGDPVADDLSILYGGSCKPSNAEELFSQPDVDGGLIGGASLNAADFIQIIEQLQ